MKIFMSDLDNTLIYSYKHEIGEEKTCVEIYQDREISYMTNRSCELLESSNRRSFICTNNNQNERAI